MNEYHPGLTLFIHVKSAVNGIPVGGGVVSVCMENKGAGRRFRAEDRTTPVTIFGRAVGGEHVKCTVIIMNLGSPVIAGKILGKLNNIPLYLPTHYRKLIPLTDIAVPAGDINVILSAIVKNKGVSCVGNRKVYNGIGRLKHHRHLLFLFG